MVLRTDAEPRDRYGRLLAYVYRRPDGLFVNAALVRDGYATILTIPPNVRHAGRLLRGRACRPPPGCRAVERVRITGRLCAHGPLLGSGPMRMRQSQAQLERAFAEEVQLDRVRREHLRRTAAQRARDRRTARRQQRSSVRFFLLVLSIIATAVLVTISMFWALGYAIG